MLERKAPDQKRPKFLSLKGERGVGSTSERCFKARGNAIERILTRRKKQYEKKLPYEKNGTGQLYSSNLVKTMYKTTGISCRYIDYLFEQSLAAPLVPVRTPARSLLARRAGQPQELPLQRLPCLFPPLRLM